MYKTMFSLHALGMALALGLAAAAEEEKEAEKEAAGLDDRIQSADELQQQLARWRRSTDGKAELERHKKILKLRAAKRKRKSLAMSQKTRTTLVRCISPPVSLKPAGFNPQIS